MSELIEMKNRIIKLERDNLALVEALQIYGNEGFYDLDYTPETGHTSEALEDCGEIARNTIAFTEKK